MKFKQIPIANEEKGKNAMNMNIGPQHKMARRKTFANSH